ncbi:hypothetical protein MCOR29_008606 [Pyricularia oryzae]|uniref:Hcy-binding domain-containing protein n=1 Tax=Pyricularia grisea TaxID=148305 RepID=A0ABQ8NY63_PYRGI|nr:hypothetical protein MCOR33_001795 [Pyricularia grisea]KAI6310422.1 hypothetical protein MCOR29_008606 [Pyricularia oryzae]
MSDIKILDGGLGTTLEDRFGVVFTHAKPLWSSDLLVSDQETLQACQREFAAAGADVLLTATYQVSVEAFARTKTPEHPDGIAPSSAMLPYLRGAVEIAEKAAAAPRNETSAPSPQPAELALACGPYGAAMTPGQEYTGAYDAAHSTSDALSRWHLDRLALYAAAGEDVPGRCAYVAFETVPNLAEVWAVRDAITRLRQDASCSRFPSRFWICCVFPHEDERLADGSSVDQVVEAMLAARGGGENGAAKESLALPWGIGINCTKIYKLEGLIKSFERSISGLKAKGVITNVPALVLYPDGTNGEVYNTTTQKWEAPQVVQGAGPKTPWDAQLTQIVNDTKGRGVFTSFLVGGCCKANPQNIKDLRNRLKE